MGDALPRGDRDGPSLPVSLWFLAVTATVLLIACANVANLLLARAATRAHEIAVRLSLGATRDRLARQLLTESLLLALLGGAAAVGVAALGVALLPRVLPLPPIADVIDRRALAFTAALTLATTLAFGLAPALRAARQDLSAVLGAAGRTRAGRSVARDALVVVQVGASLALLVAAGLFVRSLRNVRAVDTGFAVDRILLASADVRGGRFTREQSDAYWQRAVERVRALPGVRGASLGVAMPFEMNLNFGVVVPAAPSPDGRPRLTSADFASPDYFATLGIPVVAGRAFTAEDGETAAPVAIVNETFVRRYLRGVNPLSACVQGGAPGPAPACAQIVGVVADARFTGVTRDAEPFLFRPLAQRPRQLPATTMMHVRTADDPARVLGSVRRELQALDERVSFATVRPMSALIEPQLAPWRIGSFVFMLLGALGALLAAVGLYGVVSFVVAQRTRELGVRMALGARARDVLVLVLGHGARLVVIGLAAGAVVAALSTRLFTSLMFGVGALDPLVYVVMAALLASVALGAALVPARRATRVDPMQALRTGD
jgi:putative ABC transport system permease protein